MAPRLALIGAAACSLQERLVQGNIDPTVLLGGNEEQIRTAVHECIRKGGGRGHLLNLGHGVRTRAAGAGPGWRPESSSLARCVPRAQVLQQTPEESVRYFVEAAKEISLPLA